MRINAPRRLVAAGLLGLALVGPVLPATAYDDPTEIDGMVLDAHGSAIVNDVQHTVLAPGLDHVKFERLSSAGWMQVNVLRAKLSDSTVKAGYLGPDAVAGRGTVTEFADEVGALAGINGDFFDINNSYAPVGVAISETEGLLKSGSPGRNTVVGFDDAGLGRVAQVFLTGTVTLPSGQLRVSGLNLSDAPVGGISLYTSAWGDYTRARILAPGERGSEVIVGADGVVTSVSSTPGSGRLPEGSTSIVARPGANSDALRKVAVGDTVTVAYSLNQEAEDLRVAVGGQPTDEMPLLVDGRITTNQSEYNLLRNPRTAVGFDEDGDTAYFVVIDGRQAVSVGMPLTELGQLMLDLGADDALNLDGGGSSQLNTRLPGDPTTTVQNLPSDGYERNDANGLGLFLSQPGSGKLTGFTVSTANTADDSARVFPGLRRAMVAKGHDETLSSVKATPTTWETSRPGVALVADGVVTGVARGTSTITAQGSDGGLDILVLGDLDRITASASVLNLEAKGSTAKIRITGADADGYTAPIDPADLTVNNPNPGAFEVKPLADGSFDIVATASEGTATIAFEAEGKRTEVAVSVPLELKVIDDFSDIGGWYSANDRAPGGSVTITEGYGGSGGLKIAYDFTQSTATRGQYAVAPGTGIEIPGRPQKLSVWIKGDGNGSLLRLQVLQANNVRSWLDGADGSVYANYEGWQRIDFKVPETFEFPIKLERIRALETTAVKQYKGQLVFSQIQAFLPPEGIVAPTVEKSTDPLVVETGATDDSPLRVAVMSDAQFVARDPESGAVQGAREALREIVAEEPDVMVINGDLVDEASPEDFQLAKRILDEELAGADFPYYYVPGNHEIMGGAITNFEAAFGAATGVFDVQDTRFIRLNSATGKLASDFSQIELLQDQLVAAKADPSITGVVVLSHMPTNDPLPTKGSQLSDRNEADMIDSWLQKFRADSGKSIALVAGHVGAFDVSRVDGVPYVVNGNSGKGPASTPQNGGFTGWTMLGIDPSSGLTDGSSTTADWLRVEVNTRVDELTLTAPADLSVGDSGQATAAVTQDGDRTFDVAWPSSLAWSGSTNLFVGSAADAPSTAVAAFDPATRTITALRGGEAELRLSVNDKTASAKVTVAAPSPSPTPTPSASPSAKPSATSEPSAVPTTRPGPVDVYTTPGYHSVNGRQWLTVCEPYSSTTRCYTNIWATQIKQTSAGFAQVSGWAFNNLTYLKSDRSLWASNPLGTAGSWTSGGRTWRTECDTARTGRGACRNYVEASVLSPDGDGGYAWKKQELFNSIVLFNR